MKGLVLAGALLVRVARRRADLVRYGEPRPRRPATVVVAFVGAGLVVLASSAVAFLVGPLWAAAVVAIAAAAVAGVCARFLDGSATWVPSGPPITLRTSAWVVGAGTSVGVIGSLAGALTGAGRASALCVPVAIVVSALVRVRSWVRLRRQLPWWVVTVVPSLVIAPVTAFGTSRGTGAVWSVAFVRAATVLLVVAAVAGGAALVLRAVASADPVHSLAGAGVRRRSLPDLGEAMLAAMLVGAAASASQASLLVGAVDPTVLGVGSAWLLAQATRRQLRTGRAVWALGLPLDDAGRHRLRSTQRRLLYVSAAAGPVAVACVVLVCGRAGVGAAMVLAAGLASAGVWAAAFATNDPADDQLATLIGLAVGASALGALVRTSPPAVALPAAFATALIGIRLTFRREPCTPAHA